VPILASKGDERFVIALSGPLTSDHPASHSVRELTQKQDSVQVIVVNELLVRGNLSAATRDVRQRLGV
jgi:hypothetical protein